jgi:hypothetical protein
MIRTAAAVMLGSLVLAGCQTTQSTLTRTAVAGQPLRLDFVGSFNPDCTPIGTSRVLITRQPSSGRVVVSKGTGFSSYGRENPRSRCNARRMPGIIVHYIPNPGFIGQDSFDAELLFGSGTTLTKTYRLTVR